MARSCHISYSFIFTLAKSMNGYHVQLKVYKLLLIELARVTIKKTTLINTQYIPSVTRGLPSFPTITLESTVLCSTSSPQRNGPMADMEASICSDMSRARACREMEVVGSGLMSGEDSLSGMEPVDEAYTLY